MTARFALVLAASACWGGVAAAQMSPEDSLATLTTRDGLAVSLFASEPMVENPTSIAVDSRGRVWVAEGLNYRFFRNEQFEKQPGADRIKVLEDTTGDGKADKVTVFAEDIYPVPMGLLLQEKWEDGKYLGVRVITGNSPDILVFEDTDGDDVADRCEVLLTGFGGENHDHGVHGFTWGPDGKIYFTQGDGEYLGDNPTSVTGRITHVVTDRSGKTIVGADYGTCFRMNPDGTELEVLAERLRNPYGCAIDSFGNVFCSDNDDDGNQGCRMVWIMPGGDYGYRYSDARNHWSEDKPGVVPKLVGTGNGSPSGIVVYEGTQLPDCLGCVLHLDSGTRVLHRFPIIPHGAGFRTENDWILKGDDTWFRPVDLDVAPDGSVLIADWYDAGVGGHQFVDQTTGRIYRLHATDAPADFRAKPDFAPIDELYLLSLSPNLSTATAARSSFVQSVGTVSRDRRAEVERFTHLMKGPSPAAEPGHEPIVQSHLNWIKFVRDMFLQRGTGSNGYRHLLDADGPKDSFDDPAASAGVTTISTFLIRLLLGDLSGTADNTEATAKREVTPAKLSKLAATHNPAVLRAGMLGLRHDSQNMVGPLAVRSFIDAWDGSDRFYLEALRRFLMNKDIGGYLTKKLAEMPAPDGGVGEVPQPPYFPTGSNAAYLPVDYEFPPATADSKLAGLLWATGDFLKADDAVTAAVDRLLDPRQPSGVRRAGMKALVQMGDPGVGRHVLESLAGYPPSQQTELVALVAGKLDGDWHALREHPALAAWVKEGLAGDDRRRAVAAAKLIGSARLQAFADDVREIVADEDAPIELRVAAMEPVDHLGLQDAKPLLGRLIAGAKGQGRAGEIANAALATLVGLGGDNGAMLREIVFGGDYPVDLRRQALNLFVGQPNQADEVLNAAKEGKLDEALVTDAQFVLVNHPDGGVRWRANDHFSKNAKLRDSRAILAKLGDPAAGAKLFARDRSDACIKCHRVAGEGRWVGPDLSAIGVKYGKEAMLYHVLNPSGAVGYNYVTTIVATEDGQVRSGLVVNDTENEKIIKTATGDRVAIPTDEIVAVKTDPNSLMPANLTEDMSDQDLADLVAYLLSLRQSSITAEAYKLGKTTVAADREGLLAFDTLPAGEGPVTLTLPIYSPVAQNITVKTLSPVGVETSVTTSNGSGSGRGSTGQTTFQAPAGLTAFTIVVPPEALMAPGGLTTTVISDEPVQMRTTP